MQLTVNNIGKHYNKQWLFRNIDFNLNTGDSLAVLGKNGSGKSTLLQIIVGLIQSSEGTVSINQDIIENPKEYFSLTSPLLVLPPEFSICEIIDYQARIRKTQLPLNDFLERANFTEKESRKPLKYFSSGMLQRLKTSFCLFNKSTIKLFDEPLSNMDKDGVNWYLNCIEKIREKHIIIVASNHEPEYRFTNNIINL